jgi:prepilin-type processing-associated H-X9-DG protein
VSLNGVTLVAGTDYVTTTANTIGSLSAMSANDVVEVVVYDVFSVFDGNVNSDFSIGGTLNVASGVVFNEDSADVDFRVESNGNANMLFVDGGNDKVGVGHGAPTAILDVRRGDAAGVVAEFHNTSGFGIDIGTDSDSVAYISSGYTQDFVFKTNGGSGQTEQMRIIDDGSGINSSVNIGIGGTASAFGSGVATLQLKGLASNKSGAIRFIDNDGTNLASLFAQNDSTYGLSIGTNGGTGDFVRFHTGALGNTRMLIDAAGAVTMPLQPAFSAFPAGVQSNFAINTAVTVAFGTELFDQNADFASNTFTAPVTGKYQLTAYVDFQTLDTAADFYQVSIVTSNKSQSLTLDPNFSSDMNQYPMLMTILADMDASDTAQVKVFQSGGTAQTDISVASYFTGFLAC